MHTSVKPAFTLIEILVASAILIVIVLIISMVFHQGAIAWESGIARAESIVHARTLISIGTQELRSAAFVEKILPGAAAQYDYKVITTAGEEFRRMDNILALHLSIAGSRNPVGAIDVIHYKDYGLVPKYPDRPAVKFSVDVYRKNSVPEITGKFWGGSLKKDDPAREVN